MMKIEKDDSQGSLPDIRKFIGFPNPIIDKNYVEPVAPTPDLPPPEDVDSSQEEIPSNQIYTLSTAYSQNMLTFLKWKSRNTVRNKISYFASHFYERGEKEKCSYEGQLTQDNFVFDSSFESANLLAVFKVKDDYYDLVLQNDTNSGGYTQWFNFKVSNGTWKGTVTFNIVNFYKKKALYKEGMKPLARSLVYDKDWKRSCHGCDYFANEMRMENRKGKYYKTLTFKYDFNFENDTVQFCSCFPYTYTMLCNWLNSLQSPKLRIKYLGATPLRKIIAMMHISTPTEKPKRAIVLLGRQHAGETPSSYLIQNIVDELLGPNPDNQFLLLNFDFYIFPMVNVDGVAVGNYRCNSAGYDLNRSWHFEDHRDTPEVLYIKNEIKKIMKKQSIQLILDIHGHSNKFNSFFYGNSFGRNNMAFPYIASKMNSFIDLCSCTFSDPSNDKAKTARVILGNLIKDTGAVYTFQVSLFGGNKNGKKTHFILDHYQELARTLLSALNKAEVEIFKEERSLKGSLFLKEVRRQIKKIEVNLKKEEESDEQAKKTTNIEEKAKFKIKREGKSSIKQSQSLQLTGSPILSLDIGTDSAYFIESQYEVMRERRNRFQKRKEEAKGMPKKVSLSIGKIKEEPQNQNRKDFLLNKLRIFGQTFQQIKLKPISFQGQPNLLSSNAQTQTILTLKCLKESPKKELTVVRQQRVTSNNMNRSFRRQTLKPFDLMPKLVTTRGSKSNPSGLDASDFSYRGLMNKKCYL